MNHKTKAGRLTMMGLFVALITAGAFIRIPVPVVPFTLQLLFTTLAGMLFGGRFGGGCVGIYILLGLFGLPIFAEGGGFWYLLKPSFGYLLGFMLGSYLCGKMAEKQTGRLWLFTAAFLNLFCVYGIGLVYYYLICRFVIDLPLSVGTLLLYGFVLAVPGDIVLCVMAAVLTRRLRPVLGQLELLSGKKESVN